MEYCGSTHLQLYSCKARYTVNVQIFIGELFSWAINAHEKRWAILTRENLSPGKFNPRNIVTTKFLRLLYT